jgi:acyl-coenzyme A synthetase/AMP-(fatty) acid ligase
VSGNRLNDAQGRLADSLPRNAMGKVQKNMLREQHQALFRR